MVRDLVSVIIPSKNRPDFLIQALESVFAQTYKNLEVIVVDDGSTPPIESFIAERYGGLVKILRNEQSRGAPAARNAGAKLASGEFVAFLDDDDLWMPEKIERQLEIYSTLSEDYGVVYCGYNFVVNNRVVPRENKYKSQGYVFPQSLRGCPVGSPTPLIRRKCFEQVFGFDEVLPACQDWDLWVRLSKICKFSFVPQSLALYRVHGAQISVDLLRKITSRELFLGKYQNELSLHPELLSLHYCRIGALYAIAAQPEETIKLYRLALEADTMNMRARIHVLLFSISPKLDKYLTECFGITRVGGVRLIH